MSRYLNNYEKLINNNRKENNKISYTAAYKLTNVLSIFFFFIFHFDLYENKLCMNS